MDKKAVAAALEELALLSELAGENPFKVRAFENGARAVLTYPGDLAEAVRTGELARIKGIGKTLAAIITELVEKEEASLLTELRAKTPAGLLELLQVPGLGPKKARILYEKLQISSLGELEYAIQENRLLSLPGFGPRTQEKLKEGLESLRRYAGLFRLGDLLPAATEILFQLRGRPEVVRAELAGEVRRGLEVAGGLSLVVALRSGSSDPSGAEALLPGLSWVLQGPAGCTGTLPQGIPLRLRFAAKESFGAEWLWETGSDSHLEALKERAAREGMELRSEGLFKGEKLRAGAEEEEIYQALGLAFIPPELREGLGEIEAAARGRLPRLLSLADLRGCFHVHSHYSDGTNSLAELVTAAQEKGWDFLGLSDHSQSAYYAGGLKPPDLERQKAEVQALARQFPTFRLFWGIESDILGDGSLDYPEEILRGFDFVIASVHSQFRLSREEMTRRILQAMANPWCTMVGHLSGRLLLAREPYEVDHEAILQHAARYQVIMELNASPYRLDLDWRWLRRARELGVLISINPDAHSLEGLEDVTYGVVAARKGWLEPQDVLNCYPPAEVAEILARRRLPASFSPG